MEFEYGLLAADFVRGGGNMPPARPAPDCDIEATGEKTNSALLEWLKHALAEDIVTIFAAGY